MTQVLKNHKLFSVFSFIHYIYTFASLPNLDTPFMRFLYVVPFLLLDISFGSFGYCCAENMIFSQITVC